MSSGGDMYDAPNQQVVRPDGSAPWDEGEGGSTLLPDQGPTGSTSKRKTATATETEAAPVAEDATQAAAE